MGVGQWGWERKVWRKGRAEIQMISREELGPTRNKTGKGDGKMVMIMTKVIGMTVETRVQKFSNINHICFVCSAGSKKQRDRKRKER